MALVLSLEWNSEFKGVGVEGALCTQVCKEMTRTASCGQSALRPQVLDGKTIVTFTFALHGLDGPLVSFLYP